MSLPTNNIKLSQIGSEFTTPSTVVNLGELYRGGKYVSNSQSKTIPTSGPIKFSDFLGVTFTKPNGIHPFSLPGVFSYTAKPDEGVNFTIICVGGGGGGGGGNSSLAIWGPYWNWGETAGTGGGAGGVSVATVTCNPGDNIVVTVGTGGAGGHYSYGTRYGPYGVTSVGGGGGTSSVSINGKTVVSAAGGSPGYADRSIYTGMGGGGGGAGNTKNGSNGGNVSFELGWYGGDGAIGWNFPDYAFNSNSTYADYSGISSGFSGVGGKGDAASAFGGGLTNVRCTSGGPYGGGGGGGGCDYDGPSSPETDLTGANGTSGCVLIVYQ